MMLDDARSYLELGIQQQAGQHLEHAEHFFLANAGAFR
jgi:hypothetical protein